MASQSRATLSVAVPHTAHPGAGGGGGPETSSRPADGAANRNDARSAPAPTRATSFSASVVTRPATTAVVVATACTMLPATPRASKKGRAGMA